MERRSVSIYYTDCKYTMKDIELSQRMRAVADMVRPGSRVCDIGCDHAFVSIYLVANGIADRVIASDVRTGPCAIARDNISRWRLSDKIDLRLGDGLSTVKPGEADAIVIAGMGGILITDILEAGKNVVEKARQLVLQPQSELEHVRRYIYDNGWTISEENMLIDAGKYYVVINVDLGRHKTKSEAVSAAKTLSDIADKENNNKGRCAEAEETCNNPDMQEIYFKYGRYLLECYSPVLREYLEKQKRTVEALVSGLEKTETDNAVKRCQELRHELDCIDMALKCI